MVYPVIVIFIAVAIVIFLLTYIVPQFNDIFENMVQGGKKAMPALTQAVIGASEALQSYWYLLLGAVILFVMAFVRWHLPKAASG